MDRFNFSECKSVSTPQTFKKGKEDKAHNLPYRHAVGALMYFMLGTKRVLAYSVGFVSRLLENSSNEYVSTVKIIFCYVSGTNDLGIVYRRNCKKGILDCYSDADFEGCAPTGGSTTGVVILYARGVISWLSQRQVTIVTSTTEAEIVATNEAVKEVI